MEQVEGSLIKASTLEGSVPFPLQLEQEGKGRKIPFQVRQLNTQSYGDWDFDLEAQKTHRDLTRKNEQET